MRPGGAPRRSTSTSSAACAGSILARARSTGSLATSTCSTTTASRRRRVRDGELRVGRESYAAVVLPGCARARGAHGRAADRVRRRGGTLIAVGPLPAHAAGIDADDAAVAELAARFAAGAAHHVAGPDDLGAALEACRGGCAAPVPTLLRTDGDAGLLFVPAVFPRATVVELSDQARASCTRGRAISATASSRPPRARDGRRARRACRARWRCGSRSRAPDAAPTASRSTAGCGCGSTSPTGRARCSRGGWAARPLAAGARRRCGRRRSRASGRSRSRRRSRTTGADLAAPAGATVETWDLDDGVHATFGPRARWAGPAAADALPAPGDEAAGGSRRGVVALARHPQGPDPRRVPRPERPRAGGVPRLRPGRSRARACTCAPSWRPSGRSRRTWPWARRPRSARGSTAARSRSTGAGYQATGAVELPARPVVLDLRLVRDGGSSRRCARTSRSSPTSRATRARVAAPGPRGREELGRRVHDARLAPRRPDRAPTCSSAPTARAGCSSTGARSAARAASTPTPSGTATGSSRTTCASTSRAGDHELRLELLALGRTRPAALLDGLVRTEAGSVAIRSDDGLELSSTAREERLELRLPQRGDPAANHAWRRPHPLPEGDWLEPGRGTADAGAP